MNNSLLNNLQLYRGRRFSDLVDENMISNALLTKPHEVSGLLSLVFGTKDDGVSTAIDLITGGLGKTMIIDNREFEWSVMIDSDHAVNIRFAKFNGAEITTSSTSVKAGANGAPIYIGLEERFFGPGAVLSFDDYQFQVRVSGVPYQDGSAWVYECYVVDGNPASYIPYELLLPGRQVSRMGSAYEEYSDEADIINYQTPFKMRNHLQTLRLTYDITGDAYSTVLAIALKDPESGKTSYLWADYQYWLALREWKRREEKTLLFGKSNRLSDGTYINKGTNGRPAPTMSGLFEQISPANVRYYTTLTAELLEDYLFDLCYNILGTNERKFIALTGEMGIREFDRILKEKVASFSMIDTTFVTGSGQNLTLGGQFTTYKMTNGIELTLKRCALFDNMEMFRQLHPLTGKPLMSYTFLFVDLGQRDGQANIVKVCRKGREFVQWCTGGSVVPSGYANSINTLRSNSRDGYQVHFLGEEGIMLRNPLSCGILYCDAEDTEIENDGSVMIGA
ncbi:SU10 major capsid protein [Sharpea azabuensis]|uniref:SU10 major capsid protein n=1 Tax=Sharpea azabuensis TaxID=322505 RepID=UPI0015684801|nr:hypothetical protein [Sharpea azabuensis]